MPHIALLCASCGATHPADMATLSCKDCSSPLEVEYLVAQQGESTLPSRGQGAPAVPLPLHNSASAITLGEGNTPCVQLSAIGRLLGLRQLYAKLEFLNSTGSFKDRGTAVMVSVAREHGITELVEDSSGNAGASVAAYAAAAGIKAHIFAPSTAPQAKLKQISVYGAQAHLIDGPRAASTAAAVAFCAERGLVYASHALSPYFLEGTKTFAYEVVRQLHDGLPEYVVFPVGNGSLLIGAFRGFEKLRRAGAVGRVPRLHCAQAQAVKPVVAAYSGEGWTEEQAYKTIAGGIAVAAPPRIDRMVGILRATEGSAVAVADEDILRWQKLLAEREGIFAEPTSAAAFAGLELLVEQGGVGETDRVLVPVTGFGLKDILPP